MWWKVVFWPRVASLANTVHRYCGQSGAAARYGDLYAMVEVLVGFENECRKRLSKSFYFVIESLLTDRPTSVR
jgi:hypothetical protein